MEDVGNEVSVDFTKSKAKAKEKLNINVDSQKVTNVGTEFSPLTLSESFEKMSYEKKIKK